jgi:hypothetical protein
MKSILAVVCAAILAVPVLLAQDSSPVETKFKAYGNCGMCKSRIEKAVTISGVTLAKWDKRSKMLAVTYLPDAITVDSLQKRVAAAGHDTERYKASDSAYAALPRCCLYRTAGHTH